MKIPRILVLPIYIAIVAAVSVLVGLIAHWSDAYNPTAWGFFTLLGILGSYILFIFGRQMWWYMTGTGDYQKKKIDEDQDQ